MLHLYLDESGDHSLRHIQPSYPLFVLGGVILADDDAVAAAEAAMAAFKRRWFGAARVVLHTADLVLNRGAFVALKDVALRGRFFDDLNELLLRLEFSVMACAVREAIDPYLLALTVLVERFCLLLCPLRLRAWAHHRRASNAAARSTGRDGVGLSSYARHSLRAPVEDAARKADAHRPEHRSGEAAPWSGRKGVGQRPDRVAPRMRPAPATQSPALRRV